MAKDSHANLGDIRDLGSIPRLGRSPGGGHSNSLQNSCLENTMDRGACLWSFKELDTTERLIKKKKKEEDLFFFFKDAKEKEEKKRYKWG